ncbi:putative neugrin-like protein DDB_G0288135 [Agrilus planipennis]|uniref:Neugrin-like protein DDB_G0288135 n=1 Tax=Agrilus planipennis TaxID=224129 RepID=A0A1W4WTT6_AGRPL|nr:putative neugrin-like protein DDB_G0288135 [Agrilus planipennis]
MFSALKLLKPFGELFESRLNCNRKYRIHLSKSRRHRSNPEIQSEDDFEEEGEADFMNLNLSYDKHVDELKTLKEREKRLIVRQKYFKQTLPNFLTWSEKEQIRYLHHSDPELWTFEKLSDGFPALPRVISKVIKSSWTKLNDNKIKAHDISVQENWDLFKQGKLSRLPNELVDHLKQFQQRKINIGEKFAARNERSQKEETPAGEFSEIIKSYDRLKNKKTDETVTSNDINIFDYKKVQKETYLITPPDHFENKRHVQLKFLESENKIRTIPNDLLEKNEVEYRKCSETKVVSMGRQKKDYSFLLYPQKIRIPAKVRKSGCIYKLQDSFYDDDGEFLYRVPGML